MHEEDIHFFEGRKTAEGRAVVSDESTAPADGSIGHVRNFITTRLAAAMLAVSAAVTSFSGGALADSPTQKPAAVVTDSQEKLFQNSIDKSIETLKDKWGVKIIYKDFSAFLKKHNHEGGNPHLEKVADVLETLIQNFEDTYPAPMEKMIQRNHLTIYLVDSLMIVDKQEKKPDGGFQDNDKKTGYCNIVLNIRDVYIDPEAKTIDHEFVHRLDTSDTTAWATSQIFVNSTNKHGKDEYQFSDGGEAILKDWKWLPDSDDHPSQYGRNGGKLEDVAELGEKMLNVSTILDIIRRVQNSEFMRKKFNMVFGCDLDEHGNIVDLTLDEYKEKTKFKKMKLPGWRYFKRWSDIDGQIRMDAKYWQKILDKARKLEEEKKARIEAERIKEEQEMRKIREKTIKRTTLIRERNPLERASMVSSPDQLFFHLYPAHGVNPLKDDKKPVTVPPITNAHH